MLTSEMNSGPPVSSAAPTKDQPPGTVFLPLGEELHGCRLVAEIGRGGQGRVFLATQPALGDRPVVLKVTPCRGREHLSLARLQHTHIMPLYFAHDDEGRGLRVLGMPYFGGASLAQVLALMGGTPPAARTGQDVLGALARASRPDSPVAPQSPARSFLARATYEQAVCWLGACLAEGLQYAHERGLVHLDVKPANVLLAADGTPMLLDFHLARAPLRPEDGVSQGLGGTLLFMPPEQQAAMLARQRQQPAPDPVDGRADIYSLGLVLYEALGGSLPFLPGKSPPLTACNRRASPALSDLVRRCVAASPVDRYPTAAAVSADLKRHLADLPLRGVRNRSPAELWSKWRRRRPHQLPLIALTLAVALAATVGGGFALEQNNRRLEGARSALRDGDGLLRDGRPVEAEQVLLRGLDLAQASFGGSELEANLTSVLGRAREAREAAERARRREELHALADRLRFLPWVESLPPAGLTSLAESCRELWDGREELLRTHVADRPAERQRLRDDLLDVALFWAELRVRLAPGERAEAVQTLADAAALLGDGVLLRYARRALEGATQRTSPADGAPRTAWEFCYLGQAELFDGHPDAAAAHLGEAVRREPGGLWPNFYAGLCAAQQGRHEDAVTAFSVCVGARPESATLFRRRAGSLEALHRPEQALADYDRALTLEPTSASACLKRGRLRLRQGDAKGAVADLGRALDNGADPTTACYHLALAHHADHDDAAAVARLRQALKHDPGHREARELLDSLTPRR